MIQIQKSKRVADRLLAAAGMLVLGFGVVTPIIAASLAHAAGEDLSAVANKTTSRNQWVSITDLQVNGTGNDQVSIAVHAPSGKFGFDAQTATVTGLNTKSVVLTGSRNDVNQTLASMRYLNTTVGTYTITADLGNNAGNVIFNNGPGGNGHAYIIVPTLMSWQNAKNAAETYTFGGKTGYLATITGSDENQFVWDHLQATGWMGANDIATEGAWHWETGPEAGTQFWSGNGSGSAVGGNYTNWNTGEPNNSDGGEDCAQFYTAGKWNDLKCETARPFVVEFGDAGQPIEPLQTTFDVDVTALTPTSAPVLASTTPANGAAGVATNTTLSMTFDKLTYGSEGNLKIHNVTDGTSQDILNQEGWSHLDFSGNIVTVTAHNLLQPCKTYSMEIPNNLFYYSDGDTTAYYEGMNSSYAWRFSTQCDTPSGYTANAVAMHGYIIDKTTDQPVPHAKINLSCGEGGDVVIQANSSGAYSFTMGQLYDAIDSSCAFAMGLDMYASADGYDSGDMEWSAYDRTDDEWEEWIADHFGGQAFDFHLVGDGTSHESEPANTATITSATGSKTITVTVDESCTLSDVSAINAAATSTKDTAYHYATGFVKFTASGCDDGVAHVQLLYHGVSPDGLTVRKYNPTGNSYFTISGATMTKVSEGTLVSYAITDDQELDIDKTPGVITDPVGLGALDSNLANTGESQQIIAIAASLLALIGVGTLLSIKRPLAVSKR